MYIVDFYLFEQEIAIVMPKKSRQSIIPPIFAETFPPFPPLPRGYPVATHVALGEAQLGAAAVGTGDGSQRPGGGAGTLRDLGPRASDGDGVQWYIFMGYIRHLWYIYMGYTNQNGYIMWY